MPFRTGLASLLDRLRSLAGFGRDGARADELATAAGAARLRGAAAPGAPRHRARHVRDRLGRAAALLVAGVARAAARAGRSRHQHRRRSARAHHPGRHARGVPRQDAGPRSPRTAAATTRTSTASRASTARPAGSCCAARPSSPRGRTGGAPRARSAWSSTSPTASAARRRTRCMPPRCCRRTMRSSRSIPAARSAPGIRAPSGSTATRRAEAIGRPISILCPDHLRDEQLSLYADTTGGKPVVLETVRRHKNGRLDPGRHQRGADLRRRGQGRRASRRCIAT